MPPLIIKNYLSEKGGVMEALTEIEKITIKVMLKKRVNELEAMRVDSSGLLSEILDGQIEELKGILKKCKY